MNPAPINMKVDFPGGHFIGEVALCNQLEYRFLIHCFFDRSGDEEVSMPYCSESWYGSPLLAKNALTKYMIEARERMR